jgi:hypothetical protein
LTGIKAQKKKRMETEKKARDLKIYKNNEQQTEKERNKVSNDEGKEERETKRNLGTSCSIAIRK